MTHSDPQVLPSHEAPLWGMVVAFGLSLAGWGVLALLVWRSW